MCSHTNYAYQFAIKIVDFIKYYYKIICFSGNTGKLKAELNYLGTLNFFCDLGKDVASKTPEYLHKREDPEMKVLSRETV